MNKIFKVIYSKTRHCYVVVSELAKNQGKSEKSKYGMKRHNRFYRLAAIAALIISAGSLLYPMQAEAWTDTSTNNYFTAYDKNYFDKDGKRSEDWKQVEPSNTNQDKDRVGAKDTGAIAAGMFAQAGQQTVTIGNRNAAQSMGSVFIGEYKGYYNPSGNQPQGLGNNYVTSVGFMSNATKYGTIAIGAGASAKGEDNSVTLGDKDPSGTLVSSLPDPDKLTIYGASVSLGYSAQSEHGNIAIGANSVATAAASTLCTAKFRKDTDGDYNAPSSYISVGSDTVKRRITNVAAGSDANDVATVGQLSYVEQEAKAKGSWKLTAGGTNESTVEAGSKVDFSAGTDGNLSVTKTADSNNVTIGLKKDVTLGKAAQGKGGSLSVYQDPSSAGQENGNDQLGSHVRIDGSTVSIRYQNGTKDSDARGVVLGVAKDSSNPLGYMYLADGNNSYYVHGTMTSDPQALQGRLVYNSSKTGYNYIANLEDGISFSGDAVKAGSTKTNTTADTRLDPTAANHTLSITGGVTDTTKLTSNNIGVVTTPTEYDDTLNNGVTKAGGLTIQLAKDLTDITSITSQTTGSTTGAKVTLDTKDNNIDVNQGKVTNLSDGTVNATSTDAVTGKQLYNLDNSSVKYDTTGTKVDKTKITLAGGATGTTITNVKAGTISANSTDAVNGAQLYAEQQARTQDKTKYYSVQEGRQIDGFSTNENNDGASALAGLAAGYETGTTGIASTVVGSYSGVIGSWLQGAAAVSVGTVNVNSNTDTSKTYSGVANSIVGQANMTTNSNAAIIYGAGNTVTDSYRPIDEKKAATILKSISDQTKLREALQAAVKDSGGQVMVMGGVNTVDKAYMTQVVGVGNTVTGSGDAYDEDKSSQLNYVEGFYTTLTNGKNDYIIGSHNTVTGTSTETNQSNIVFGDNHTLTNTKNNVILGSLDAVDETTVSDVVSIGHNAKVTKEGGVAIGSGSEATTAAGVAGYDPTGATADTTAAWTSKKAAVSVGTADETRQITGVAAGKEETDAVNVAQLKKLNGMKANVNADNIGKNLNHKADGTAVTDEDKTANENDWGAAIGTGSIASDSSQLVTGKTVYSEVRPTADGKYVKTTKTTGENLTALDTQVGTNTGDIKDLKDLKNITEAGQTVIKNLSKDA
uniref:ESPR-type extended signal peptide-containing protein n=1 Tax=Megasphaera elsdenii TaxID=907 RepID=UPI0022E53FB3